MSVFSPGGGSLKSTNMPAAFIELAHTLSAAEKQISTIDEPVTNITVAFDAETLTAAIAASIPISSQTDSDGSLKIVASDYVVGSALDTAFSAGTNGSLNSDNLAAAFLELANQLNYVEQNSGPEPPNNITIALDLETRLASVTASLPLTTTLDASGRVVIAPVDYLP